MNKIIDVEKLGIAEEYMKNNIVRNSVDIINYCEEDTRHFLFDSLIKTIVDLTKYQEAYFKLGYKIRLGEEITKEDLKV